MVGLLNQKGQKQTYRPTRQISKETDLTKFSIVQIIHCIFGQNVFCLPTRLLSIIVSFSCIYISQGSVATKLMFDGIFNNHFIADCPQNAAVKIFLNRLILSKDMDKSKVACFYGPCCSQSGCCKGVTTQIGDYLQTGKPPRYITITKVNSAFYPSGVEK